MSNSSFLVGDNDREGKNVPFQPAVSINIENSGDYFVD